ncbi:MAG: PQQ-binding-like beta-propeller repeat protein [Verrucomicrobia bacterium]|nr:PQQ-binding-like beta-propeller repeat protein [Verrucomicrobiota bacterium]
MINQAIRRICAGFLVAGCLGVASAGDGNEWPQFRGPGGSGIAQDPKSSGVPTEWDTTNNVAWRIDVPGLGWSSPIVWGNRVFITTAVDAQVWSFSEPQRKSRENWGFGASPVMHGGRVYLVHDNEEDAYVVQTGPTFRLLATNTLERLCLATPAVAGDRLLIRTSVRLYCIGSE